MCWGWGWVGGPGRRKEISKGAGVGTPFFKNLVVLCTRPDQRQQGPLSRPALRPWQLLAGSTAHHLKARSLPPSLARSVAMLPAHATDGLGLAQPHWLTAAPPSRAQAPLARAARPRCASSLRPARRPPPALRATPQDIRPNWDSVLKTLDYNVGLSRFAGSDVGWLDLDMLYGEPASVAFARVAFAHTSKASQSSVLYRLRHPGITVFPYLAHVLGGCGCAPGALARRPNPCTAPPLPFFPHRAVGNDTGLRFGEQRAHFALWSLYKSPLMIGHDLRDFSKQSLSVLLSKARPPLLRLLRRPAEHGAHRPTFGPDRHAVSPVASVRPCLCGPAAACNRSECAIRDSHAVRLAEPLTPNAHPIVPAPACRRSLPSTRTTWACLVTLSGGRGTSG